MDRSRLVSVVFVLLCFATGGLVLHHFQGPMLKPAVAQGEGSPYSPHDMPLAKAADRKAAIAVIEAQLAAFRKGDYQKAMQYQSARLKQNFGSPAQFRQMMESYYPEFARSQKVDYGRARAYGDGQHLFLPVRVTGQNGVTVRAAYLMVREGHVYRVESVMGGGRQTLPSGPDNSASA